MNGLGLPVLLAQEYDGAAGGIAAGVGVVMCIVYVALIVAIIAGVWKTFEKAGEPGWAAIVPIYNGMVLAKIAGKEMWWGLLLIIPCVGIVISFILCIEVAKRFGKDTLFGILLALFGFIFFPVLGFGSAQYQKSSAT